MTFLASATRIRLSVKPFYCVLLSLEMEVLLDDNFLSVKPSFSVYSLGLELICFPFSLFYLLLQLTGESIGRSKTLYRNNMDVHEGIMWVFYSITDLFQIFVG